MNEVKKQEKIVENKKNIKFNENQGFTFLKLATECVVMIITPIKRRLLML